MWSFCCAECRAGNHAQAMDKDTMDKTRPIFCPFCGQCQVNIAILLLAIVDRVIMYFSNIPSCSTITFVRVYSLDASEQGFCGGVFIYAGSVM